MALSKRARGYTIAIPVVTAFFILYLAVPAFQSNANVVFGWIKSFRNWKHNWGWVIALGVIGLLGLLYLLVIIAQLYVAGMVKREEIRTGKKIPKSGPGPAGDRRENETRRSA
jgi:hypothetical protein